jgi:nucleoside-diphosphate-sugar epimerase
MKRIVVTGAGGCVGGFLARSLAAQHFEVTAVARVLPEDALRHDALLVWRKADLLDGDAMPEHFDALVHCAAELPARCPDPDTLYERNMALARSLFPRAVKAGAQIVINCSSMSVYGKIAVPVVTEELSPDQPDPYGRAKWDAERLLESLAVECGLSALSIRLPGTVGRGSHHNFLSDTLVRILAGDVVRARNPDAAFNNVVYVGDLAMFVADWLRAARRGSFVTNLAADEPMSIREMLSLMFVCAGRPQRLVFEPGGFSPFLIAQDHARTLGYRAGTVRSSVSAMVRDWLEP